MTNSITRRTTTTTGLFGSIKQIIQIQKVSADLGNANIDNNQPAFDRRQSFSFFLLVVVGVANDEIRYQQEQQRLLRCTDFSNECIRIQATVTAFVELVSGESPLDSRRKEEQNV
jgi:hypothetical protein